MSGAPFFILETAGGGEATLADPTTFGRAEDNSVVLRDASVSSHHAAIRKDGAFWIVEDLGSTNGTWLNHKRVDGKAVIKEGDQIQFGSQMIRVSGFRGMVDRRASMPAQACLRCSKALPVGAAFCPYCGIPIPPPVGDSRPPAPPVSTTAPFAVPHPQEARRIHLSRPLLGCLLAGVLLVLLGLLAGWWLRDGSARDRAPGSGSQSAMEATPGVHFVVLDPGSPNLRPSL